MEDNKDSYQPPSISEVYAEALMRGLPDFDIRNLGEDPELQLALEFYNLTPKIELYEHLNDLIEMQGSDARMIVEVIGDTNDGQTVCRLISSTSPHPICAVLMGSFSVFDGESLETFETVQIIAHEAMDGEVKNVKSLRFELKEGAGVRIGVYARHEIARDSHVVYRKLFTAQEAEQEFERKIASGEPAVFVPIVVRTKEGTDEQFYMDHALYYVQDIVRSRIVDSSIKQMRRSIWQARCRRVACKGSC